MPTRGTPFCLEMKSDNIVKITKNNLTMAIKTIL